MDAIKSFKQRSPLNGGSVPWTKLVSNHYTHEGGTENLLSCNKKVCNLFFFRFQTNTTSSWHSLQECDHHLILSKPPMDYPPTNPFTPFYSRRSIQLQTKIILVKIPVFSSQSFLVLGFSHIVSAALNPNKNFENMQSAICRNDAVL